MLNVYTILLNCTIFFFTNDVKSLYTAHRYSRLSITPYSFKNQCSGEAGITPTKSLHHYREKNKYRVVLANNTVQQSRAYIQCFPQTPIGFHHTIIHIRLFTQFSHQTSGATLKNISQIVLNLCKPTNLLEPTK